MKKILSYLILVFISGFNCFSQCSDESFYITFDDSNCLERVCIDTISDTNNIWQIGTLNKAMADAGACNTLAIMTDTVNPYPINDTSSFVLKTVATYGIYYGIKAIWGSYYVQSDSLNDFGMMEFSPDNGQTWYDMLNDTVFSANFFWFTQPAFTGNSKVCAFFECYLCDAGSAFGIDIGDTVQFRFTFISDSIFDNKCGLLFDNFQFWDYVEGISEIRFHSVKSKVYPNPVAEDFTIEFDNPDAASFDLAVYDIHSRPVLKQDNITTDRISLDAALFRPGIYLYKITNVMESKRSWGKFVVLE